MAGVRIHRKHSGALVDFLNTNSKKFSVEKTSSGFPTVEYGDKLFYVRDKRTSNGWLNRISTFQSQVGKSKLYKFLDLLFLSTDGTYYVPFFFDITHDSELA